MSSQNTTISKYARTPQQLNSAHKLLLIQGFQQIVVLTNHVFLIKTYYKFSPSNLLFNNVLQFSCTCLLKILQTSSLKLSPSHPQLPRKMTQACPKHLLKTPPEMFQKPSPKPRQNLPKTLPKSKNTFCSGELQDTRVLRCSFMFPCFCLFLNLFQGFQCLMLRDVLATVPRLSFDAENNKQNLPRLGNMVNGSCGSVNNQESKHLYLLT